jgi:hypothetical protein
LAYREIRWRLEGARSLLDIVGRIARENSAAVRVDVSRHGEAPLAAIETMLPMMAVLAVRHSAIASTVVRLCPRARRPAGLPLVYGNCCEEA